MIAIFPLLAAAALTAPGSQVDPIETFRKVCLEGEAKFSKGSITEIPLRRVPWQFHYFLRDEGFKRFYLSADRKTLIATLQNSQDDQMCAVITMAVDKRRIYELGFPKVGPDTMPPLFDQRDVERSIDSSLGYQIVASRYGRMGLALTSYILTAKERQELETEMRAANTSSAGVSDGYFRRKRTVEPK